jgi:hypothetical protein
MVNWTSRVKVKKRKNVERKRDKRISVETFNKNLVARPLRGSIYEKVRKPVANIASRLQEKTGFKNLKSSTKSKYFL